MKLTVFHEQIILAFHELRYIKKRDPTPLEVMHAIIAKGQAPNTLTLLQTEIKLTELRDTFLL